MFMENSHTMMEMVGMLPARQCHGAGMRMTKAARKATIGSSMCMADGRGSVEWKREGLKEDSSVYIPSVAPYLLNNNEKDGIGARQEGVVGRGQRQRAYRDVSVTRRRRPEGDHTSGTSRSI